MEIEVRVYTKELIQDVLDFERICWRRPYFN